MALRRNLLAQSVINGLIVAFPIHSIPNPRCVVQACPPAEVAPEPLVLDAGYVGPMVAGVSYYYGPVVTNGTGPYTFTLAPTSDPLPTGMIFDAEIQGIDGTPTVIGESATITFVVTDANGATGELELTFTVVEQLLAAAPDPYPADPQVGVPYSFVPVITGGVPPYTAAQDVNSDPIPDGFSINPTTGEVFGTPLPGSEGPALVIVLINDASGQGAIVGASLNVQPA